MMKLSSPLIALFLMVGVAGGSGKEPTHPIPFCPDCWKFLQSGDLDGAGRCVVSGKMPVDVEAVTMSWFWCLPHHAWHRRPCGQDFSRSYESVALLVPSGSENVSVQAYCPMDRTISDLGYEGSRCPVCSRPFVATAVVERRWYWCGTQKRWLTQPCSANRNLLLCCRPRKGTVLAYSWDLPFLHEVSTGMAPEGLTVSPEWLALHLDDPHLIVLHVGFDFARSTASRSSYFDGHIPGARHLSWEGITRTRNGLSNEMPPAEQLVKMVRSFGIDAEDRIVLYDTGWGLEAARAYVTLDYLGLADKAVLLDGQWARWKALNLPETRMIPDEIEPSNVVPRLRPEILVSLETMKELVSLSKEEGSRVTLLDARPAAEFHGAMSGRIEGARNLCWATLLEKEGGPVFREVPDLRAIFESAGARPGHLVVVYCRTGVQASLLYVAAKSLGYDVKLYDGSSEEWKREHGSPAEDRWARR